MSRHFLSPFAVSIACLMIVSCATVQKPSDEASVAQQEPAGWVAEKQTRQQIVNWEIRGRLGLQTERTGGSMDLIWKQSGDDFTIRLIAPLGAGSYLIQGGKDFADIRFPDGKKQTLEDIDDVFSSTLGVDLPASAIKDWVRGLPAAAMPVDGTDWNQHGLINRLQQSGWNVEMTKYSGTKILLPHAIYVSRDDDSELDIRLILRQWLVDN